MDPTETRKLGRNSNARSKFCSGTCTPYQSTELAPTGSASSDSSRLEAKARAGARAGAPGRQAAEEPFKQIGARSTWIDAGFAAGLQKCSRLSLGQCLGLTGLVGGVCFNVNVQCCALEAKNGAQWARRRVPSLFPFSRTPARKGPRVVQSHFQPYRVRTTDHLRRTEYQTRDVNQDAGAAAACRWSWS